MNYIKLLLAGAASVMVIAGLTSCTRGGKGMDKYKTGGTNDHTDYSAPKTIESDDLIYFNTEFYFESDIYETLSGTYSYELVKSEDGIFTLSENNKYKVSSEISQDEVALIQALIRKENIAKANGTDKLTAGLPPEFAESIIRCEYSSGEKIYIRDNSNPLSPFSKQLNKICQNIFLAHGIEEVRLPKELRSVTCFELMFSDDNLLYQYMETTDENGDKRINRIVFGISENEVLFDKTAPIPEGYYEKISDLIEKTDFIKYENRETALSGVHIEFAEFRIETEADRQFLAFYDKDEIPAAFTADAYVLTGYIDTLFAEQ